MTKRRPKSASTPSLLDPAGRAELLRDFTRLLGQQEFANEDELRAFLEREVMGKPLPRVEAATPQEQAEDLVRLARTLPSDARARAKVNEALALDPDCLSAHLFLSELAETPTDAQQHLQAAVASGDRTLDAMWFEPDADPWYDPTGREYLMAMGMLAELRWRMGDRRQAIADGHELLKLSPNDGAGFRYQFIEWLMRAGSLAEIDALLAAYQEKSAVWCYAAALHAFRQRGPDAAATRALRVAVAVNPHVVAMLIGREPLPMEVPDSYSTGSVEEATLYVQGAASSWFDAEGAIEWARDVGGTAPKRKPKRR
ncbi:MAG: hypothetical protein K2R93_09795 [Gemmatimonadaceae bacterium]|nr:hypothetical protein [Gemmatimonadaceae bacterium]